MKKLEKFTKFIENVFFTYIAFILVIATLGLIPTSSSYYKKNKK